MNEFIKPDLDYVRLAPLFIVFGVACAGILVEAFVPRRSRFVLQTGLALIGLAVAFAVTVRVALNLPELGGGAAHGVLTAGATGSGTGTLAIDGPAVFMWGLILLLALCGVGLFAERQLDGGVSAFAGQAAALPGTDAERQAAELEHTEVYPLLLFSVGGMMLFPSATDLLTLFVALEVLSLPLYLLSGLARRRRLLSQEAAMKYFLLGAFSSGFFLYGMALIYGFSGSMDYATINEAVRNDVGNDTLLLLGIGLLLVGLLFKVGAVPFHAWMPDVYQGAPTAVTAFMAAATKAAAFGALLRLLYVAFGSERWSWTPTLWLVAIATMLVGAVMALTQTDMKRMLAYSSIAHTGFLLTGVLGLQATGALAEGEISSLQAVMFYLTTYGFATLGAFAVVSLVRDASGEQGQIARWAGLGRTAPVVAGVFALFLLAMAGIPLTSGFVGKWTVFTAAGAAGAWPVVLVAVTCSVIAAVFYVRVIMVMFFAEPVADGPAVTTPSVFTATVIALGVGITLMLGVFPGPVLELAGRAGEFIR